MATESWIMSERETTSTSPVVGSRSGLHFVSSRVDVDFPTGYLRRSFPSEQSVSRNRGNRSRNASRSRSVGKGPWHWYATIATFASVASVVIVLVILMLSVRASASTPTPATTSTIVTPVTYGYPPER
jgi:hypothetical protein